jgi:co-chaperonin GroES (HSP10)
MKTKLLKDLIFDPLHNYVVVQPFSIQEVKEIERGVAKDKIVMPNPEKRGKVLWGRVLACGEGKLENGAKIPMKTKEKDVVIFSEYDSYDVILAGVGYTVVREEFIFSRFKT